jgi:metal-responsive CopG/Arc/MetJ family transcriptional regulator
MRSHLNGLRTQVDLTPALTTRMKSPVGIIMNLPKTSEECQAKLKMVQAAIRKQIKDSVQIRLNKIEDQAELAALDGKSNKIAELRKL